MHLFQGAGSTANQKTVDSLNLGFKICFQVLILSGNNFGWIQGL